MRISYPGKHGGKNNIFVRENFRFCFVNSKAQNVPKRRSFLQALDWIRKRFLSASPVGGFGSATEMEALKNIISFFLLLHFSPGSSTETMPFRSLFNGYGAISMSVDEQNGTLIKLQRLLLFQVVLHKLHSESLIRFSTSLHDALCTFR